VFSTDDIRPTRSLRRIAGPNSGSWRFVAKQEVIELIKSLARVTKFPKNGV
jgi:hypothetical protein